MSRRDPSLESEDPEPDGRAGHTHRPACPSEEECPYFNDGSCVHPDCITCVEIERSTIAGQVGVKTKEDRTVYVDRELIAVPRRTDSIGREWRGPRGNLPVLLTRSKKDARITLAF